MKPISVGSISNTLKEIVWQLQGMLNRMDQEEQLVNLNPNLNENTVRAFLKKYRAMKNRRKKNSTSPINGIPAKRRARPLMLGILDKKNARFLDCTLS